MFKKKIKRPIAVYTIVTVVFLAKLFRLTTQVISQYAVVSDHKNNILKGKIPGGEALKRSLGRAVPSRPSNPDPV